MKKHKWLLPAIIAVAVCIIAIISVIFIKKSQQNEKSYHVAYDAHYIRTDRLEYDGDYPAISIINSKDELNRYCLTYDNHFDLNTGDTTASFLDACNEYGANFFENKSLVFIVVTESSGSNRHKVNSVKANSQGELFVDVSSVIPESGDDDMTSWHIMVEVPKENAPEFVNNINAYVDGELLEVFYDCDKNNNHTTTENNIVDDPIDGYCGNTVTTIYKDGQKIHTFEQGNSVTISDILANLKYDQNKLCKCLPEYTVETEFGTYGVSLSGYARCDKGQCELTQEQLTEITNIFEWAKQVTKEYTDTWLDKTTAEKYDNDIFTHITITEIYSNCFFAQTVIPMPYKIKLNGSISSDWCIGDQVICKYENTYYDKNTQRVEVDVLLVEPSFWQPEPDVAYKPVIYLYPEHTTDVSVKLDLNGQLTCTYPEYNNGWNVTAAPDGMLTDKSGKTYNYLYWEGDIYTDFDMSKGFCVKGEDTAQFLEDSLLKLGLNRREANEFIVYWLPIMQNNPYNIISFQTKAYTDVANLDVKPAPDTVIRVFMTWKSCDEYVQIKNQNLTAPMRNGFTVVEWGGSEIK